MKRKVWVVIGFLTVTAAVIVGFLYWSSPERRIRAVLSDGEAAIEAKDLDRVMSHVSLQYRDERGFAYLTVKKLLRMACDEFEGFDLRLGNVHIDVQENGAVIQTDLEVLIIAQGKKAYLIGSREGPVPIRITMAKETMRWLVQSVDGIRMPFTGSVRTAISTKPSSEMWFIQSLRVEGDR